MTSFSISNFRSDIASRSVQKTTHSQVVFSAPTGLQGEYSNLTGILIRCESSSIPGVTITTDDSVRRYGYGPIEKAPGTPLFDAFQCQFLVDGQGDIYKFFYDWKSLVINFDGTRSMMTAGKYSNLPYEQSYFTDYVTDIFVTVFDQTTNQIMQYQLLNAWPQSMQEQQMSWGDQDQVCRLGITFQYREWKQTTNSVSTSITSPLTQPTNALSSIMNVPKSVLDQFSSLF